MRGIFSEVFTQAKEIFKEGNFNGLKEAHNVTENALSHLSKAFRGSFKDVKGALFAWGATGRYEMGPRSDLDIIVVTNLNEMSLKGRLKFKAALKKFIREIKKQLPHNKIDLLVWHDIDNLISAARTNGIDRQAVALAHFVCGDEEVRDKFFKTREANITLDRYGNVRELAQIFTTNKWRAQRALKGDKDFKFVYGGLRASHFLFQFAKYYFDFDPRLVTIEDAAKKLAEAGVISKKECLDIIRATDVLLWFRLRGQTIQKTPFPKITSSLIKEIAKREKIKEEVLRTLLNLSRQRIFSILGRVEQKFIIPEIVRTSRHKNKKLIKKLLDYSTSVTKEVEVEAMKSSDQIVKMLCGARTKDPNVLDFIATNNPGDWYVLYRVATNPNAAPETLHKLVVPPSNLPEHLKKLYRGQEWRNIRLYVVRNPNVSARTLKVIKKYRSLWGMDRKESIEKLRKIKQGGRLRHKLFRRMLRK